MKSKFKTAAVLATLALTSGLATFQIATPTAQAQQKQAAKKIWAKSYLGQKAPALQVEKWLTKQPSTQGKFVLIDFWATWCPPCRKTIPELNELHKKFGGKLTVIGISDEIEKDVRALKEPVINYALAIDTQARTKNEYAVTGIPHVVIIDPKGIVRWEGFPLLEGYELTPEVVKNIIAKYS